MQNGGTDMGLWDREVSGAWEDLFDYDRDGTLDAAEDSLWLAYEQLLEPVKDDDDENE